MLRNPKAGVRVLTSSAVLCRLSMLLFTIVALPEKVSAACCVCNDMGVTICGSGGCTACYGGGVPLDSSGSQAISIPNSKEQKLVRIDATLAKGQAVNLMATSGSMIRFVSRSLKRTIAVVVTSNPSENNKIIVSRYNIKVAEDGGEAVIPISQDVIRINESFELKLAKAEAITLKILSVGSLKPEDQSSVSSCCVSIEETRICSSSVISESRSCCALTACQT